METLALRTGRLIATLPFAVGLLVLCAATAAVPLLGVFAILGLTIVAVGLHRPSWLLAAAFFLIPFDRMAVLAPADSAGFGNVTFLATLTVTKLFLLGLLGVLFLRGSLLGLDGRFASLRHSILGAALLFIGASFISGVQAEHLGFWALTLSRRLSLLMLMVLILLLVTSRRQLVGLMALVTASYAIVAGMGVYETLTQDLVLPKLGIPVIEVAYLYAGEGFRPIAAYGDPNTLALNMAAAAILGITLALVHPTPWMRLGAGTLLLLAGFVIVGTASRGGMLALAAGSSVFLVILRTRTRLLLALGVPLLVLGALTFATDTSAKLMIARLTGEVGGESIQYRMGWASMTLEMFLDHPILGVGTSHFLIQYGSYIHDAVPRDPYYPHNSFLQILAEHGIVGFTGFIAMYLIATVHYIRSALAAKATPDRALAVGLLALLTALAAFAATSNTVEMEVYWITFTFATVLWRTRHTPLADTPSETPAW